MQYRIAGYTTSDHEIKDLFVAWVAISFAFALVLGGGVVEFLVAAVTVGTGFVFHELGHKIVAQKYGCFAEFRASYSMLGFAVVMAYLLRVIFAAPGAVMIAGHVNNVTNGKISVAGPLVNIVMAAIFKVLMIVFGTAGILGVVFGYGFLINTWLALFNLIPYGVLDGAKVLRWNKNVYGAMVIIGFVFLLMG